MPKQPIDIMLDAIDFTPIERTEDPAPGVLYATHEGILRIQGFDFKVYQLSDGRRVIDADDVEHFFTPQPNE